MNQLCGAIIDPAETERACVHLARTQEPLFGDAQSELRGYGVGKSVFLWDAERKLFGAPLPRWVQYRGTCTMQGTGRAMQYSILWAIAFGDHIGNPTQLAPDSIYSCRFGKMHRSHEWGCRCGNCPDGNYGSACALFVHEVGLLEKKQYGTIDLSKPGNREDLAITWANNGLPISLVDASKPYRAKACFRAMHVEDVRDGIAAGYGAARCANRATGSTRDQNGMSGTVSSGGHCQCINGVFEDWKGRLCFTEIQSWPGDAAPHGGGTLKLKGGREVELPDATGGIHADDVQSYLDDGEIWLFAPPDNTWNRPKPSEAA